MLAAMSSSLWWSTGHGHGRHQNQNQNQKGSTMAMTGAKKRRGRADYESDSDINTSDDDDGPTLWDVMVAANRQYQAQGEEKEDDDDDDHHHHKGEMVSRKKKPTIATTSDSHGSGPTPAAEQETEAYSTYYETQLEEAATRHASLTLIHMPIEVIYMLFEAMNLFSIVALAHTSRYWQLVVMRLFYTSNDDSKNHAFVARMLARTNPWLRSTIATTALNDERLFTGTNRLVSVTASRNDYSFGSGSSSDSDSDPTAPSPPPRYVNLFSTFNQLSRVVERHLCMLAAEGLSESQKAVHAKLLRLDTRIALVLGTHLTVCNQSQTLYTLRERRNLEPSAHDSSTISSAQGRSVEWPLLFYAALCYVHKRAIKCRELATFTRDLSEWEEEYAIVQRLMHDADPVNYGFFTTQIACTEVAVSTLDPVNVTSANNSHATYNHMMRFEQPCCSLGPVKMPTCDTGVYGAPWPRPAVCGLGGRSSGTSSGRVAPFVQLWDELDDATRNYLCRSVSHMRSLWHPLVLGWLLREIGRRGGQVEWCAALINCAVALSRRYNVETRVDAPHTRCTKNGAHRHFLLHCQYAVNYAVLADPLTCDISVIGQLFIGLDAVARLLANETGFGSLYAHMAAPSKDARLAVRHEFDNVLQHFMYIYDEALQQQLINRPGDMALRGAIMRTADAYLQLLMHRRRLGSGNNTSGGGAVTSAAAAAAAANNNGQWHRAEFERLFTISVDSANLSPLSLSRLKADAEAKLPLLYYTRTMYNVHFGFSVGTAEWSSMYALEHAAHLVNTHRLVELFHVGTKRARLDTLSLTTVSRLMGATFCRLFATPVPPHMEMEVVQRAFRLWDKELAESRRRCFGPAQAASLAYRDGCFLLLAAMLGSTPTIFERVYEQVRASFLADQHAGHTMHCTDVNTYMRECLVNRTLLGDSAFFRETPLVFSKHHLVSGHELPSGDSSSSRTRTGTSALARSEEAMAFAGKQIDLSCMSLVDVVPHFVWLHCRARGQHSAIAALAIRCMMSSVPSITSHYVGLLTFLLMHHDIPIGTVFDPLELSSCVQIVRSLNLQLSMHPVLVRDNVRVQLEPCANILGMPPLPLVINDGLVRWSALDSVTQTSYRWVITRTSNTTRVDDDDDDDDNGDGDDDDASNTHNADDDPLSSFSHHTLAPTLKLV